MAFDPKRVTGEGVERWTSLLDPIIGGTKSADTANPLFYNFAPKDKFVSGHEDKYRKLVGGGVSVAGPAEIAPPRLKGISRFKS